MARTSTLRYQERAVATQLRKVSNFSLQHLQGKLTGPMTPAAFQGRGSSENIPCGPLPTKIRCCGPKASDFLPQV